MGEKVKAYWSKIKETLKKVSKKVYIAGAVLLLLAVVLVVWLNNRPYEVLFTELNTTEMSSILTYLEEAGVTDYQVQNNDTVLVPAHQEAALRAQLLMEEYPQSGFGYTYSTNAGALATESERNAAELRDLQDRMSAVVRYMDGVRDAVVTINLGEDSGYVLSGDRIANASASVFVTMNDSAKLTTEQAAAIRRLVAHSVKGLEIDSVTIEDALGNSYSTGAAVADSEASALKLQLEEEWENKIRTNVLQVLIPYYGPDNVKVGVNCTVDVSQTVEDSTDVYLPEWAQDGSTNGRGIVGSRIYNYVVVRDGDETTGGAVGTSTNSDFPEYVEDLPELTGEETELDLSGQVDYDNSRSEKHIVRTAGYLTDCSISVSINSTTAGNVNIPEISQHVARAAGIMGVYDEQTGEEYLGDKISIMAQPFYEEPVQLPLPAELPVENWVIFAAIGGLVLFLILLLIFLLLRRRKKKKKKKKKGELDEQYQDVDALLAAAAAFKPEAVDTGADVMTMQSEKSIELRKDIRKFAEDNPEIAAQMLKGWLRGGDENG